MNVKSPLFFLNIFLDLTAERCFAALQHRRVVSLEKLKRIRSAVFCAGMSNFRQSRAEIPDERSNEASPGGVSSFTLCSTKRATNIAVSRTRRDEEVKQYIAIGTKKLYESPRPSFGKIGLHRTAASPRDIRYSKRRLHYISRRKDNNGQRE